MMYFIFYLLGTYGKLYVGISIIAVVLTILYIALLFSYYIIFTNDWEEMTRGTVGKLSKKIKPYVFVSLALILFLPTPTTVYVSAAVKTTTMMYDTVSNDPLLAKVKALLDYKIEEALQEQMLSNKK